MAQDRATLDRLSRPPDALLGAFEPEGMAAAESLAKRLEASCSRLEACIRGAAKDAVQHTLGLVKTHLPEADLDPVGDGIPEDCSDAEWEANHASVRPSVSWPSCRLPVSRSFFISFAAKKVGQSGPTKNNIYVNNVFRLILILCPQSEFFSEFAG